MFKNISTTFLNHLLGVLLGVINSVILTRILGVEGKGVYAILIAFLGLSAVFFNIGLPAAVTYFISSKKYAFNKIFYSGILVIFSTSSLFYLLLYLNNQFIDTSFLFPEALETKRFELILLFLFAFKFLNSFLRAVFLGLQSVVRLNTIDIAFLLFSTLLHLYLFFIYSFDEGTSIYDKAFILLSIQVTVQFLNSVVNAFLLLKEKQTDFSLGWLSIAELKPFLLWGGIAYLSNLFQFLNYRLDFWFVEYFSGLSSVGIYSLSVNLVQMVWILPNAISAVLLPYIADDSQETSKNENTLIIGRLIFSLLLVVGLIAMLFSPVVISWLYGNEFEASAGLFNILLISAIPYGLITVYASFLGGKGLLIKNLNASLMGLIATVILDIILIPSYEVTGAAFASTCSYLVTSAYVIYEMKKYTNKNYLDLFLLNKSDILLIKNKFYGGK